MQKTGKLYFNPHFRKGSDHNYTVVYAVFMISIHTSAREVTNPDPKLDPVSYISIHTSAREVTYPVRNIPASPGNFNPHFRKGSDRKLDSNICRSHISIHTSAREVTGTRHPLHEGVAISIHTSAREVTKRHPFQGAFVRISIHTSAREVTAIFHKNICLFL